jgi:tol-pal system protein YbgF
MVGCAATPPDKDPVQIKLNDLDARLARVERVVTNQSLLDLANELEAARADVRSMHNDVDQINNSLEQTRKQQHDLYADLDRRVKALEVRGAVVAPAGTVSAPSNADGSIASGFPATAGGASAAPNASAAPSTSAAPSAAPGGSAGGATAGASRATGARADVLPVPDGNDRANYQAAFALLKDSHYDQAIGAFRQFLVAFPDSNLADNAQYWLGEAHYVNKDYPDALSAFQAVIDKYPLSRKTPDALLKIGYCDYELKQIDRAKEVLGDVVAKYADTPAGHLAEQRLEKIAAEAH